MINDRLTLHGKTIPNRVVFNPMEGCDGTFAGGIGELTKRRYLRFAESGAGIIWFEATAVSDECRANPRQLFLTPETADGFKKLLDEIRERALKTGGPVPLLVLQSTNSGRWSKPDGAPRPIVAYRNSLWEKGREDLEYITASDDYCKALGDKYEKAARLASDAGFDGIDVKCSHGYLLNEFLSAYDRPGIYGGCFENRTRLFFECVDAALANAGKDTFVTTRLNACDCFPHPFGFGTDKNGNPDLRETKQIISLLAGKGVGLINLTLGNPYLIPHINKPCRNAPEPEETGLRRIRDITGELQKAFPEIPFVIPGLSCLAEKSVDYAETALKEGVCSLAGWGRMTL
ncbi:MAG: flavin oxidoreductase/NADH oxidase, partial [Clostridia bacterium]|nr:flavin oxidoreductase/NADH oxidase [Clostridia bacterium]